MVKTTLPHTYNNQQVLRECGQEFANRFTNSTTSSGPSLWDRIANYFPTVHTVGFKAGEHLAVTYGAQWSNSAIDAVVRNFFQPNAQTVSTWSWEGIKRVFNGATQTAVGETLKLTITPNALPYISFFTSTAGSIALPTVVSLVSATYQRVMHDPYALNQLTQLPLSQLYTIDTETGRLRDAFGRLMSETDMEKLLTTVASYDLVYKLIEVCHQIDQSEEVDNELQDEAKKALTQLVEAYVIKRGDGQKMFPDGTLVTLQDEETINRGVKLLSGVNPTYDKGDISALIALLAKHSLNPFGILTSADKASEDTLTPKRMPAVFEGENAWKNAIIRTIDNQYVVSQDVNGKKKGVIVSDEEMTGIFADLENIQKQKATEQKQQLHTLFVQDKQSLLIEQLNQLNQQEVKAFLFSYIIQRVDDKQAVYLNGDVLTPEEWQKFQQTVALLPTRREARAEKLKNLVQQIAIHVPKEKDGMTECQLIACKDDQYVDYQGIRLEKTEVEKRLEKWKLDRENSEQELIDQFTLIEDKI